MITSICDSFKIFSTWTGPLFLLLIATVVFFIFTFIKRKNFFSYGSFYSFCYYVVMFLGTFFLYILWKVYEFERLDVLIISKTLFLSLVSYVLFALLYSFFKLKIRIPFFLTLDEFEIRFFSNLLIFLFLFSLSVFVIFNGGFVLFKSSTYESRYVANAGLGLVVRFFPLYIFGLVLRFLINPSWRVWKICFFSGLMFGLLTYIAMGGYRQILVVHCFVFFILAFRYGYFGRIKFVVLSLSMIPFLFLLAVIRYRSSVDNLGFQFLVSILDSFSPSDSFGRIYYFYNHYTAKIPGPSVVLNEFYALIPRLIWPDKPSLLYNSGNFYTKVILGYNFDVTISPTVNGSFYLISGEIGVVLGAFCVAVILKIFDNNFYRKSIGYIVNPNNFMSSSFYYFSIYFVFVLAREGFEVFIQRSLLYLVIIYFLSVAVRIFVNFNKIIIRSRL